VLARDDEIGVVGSFISLGGSSFLSEHCLQNSEPCSYVRDADEIMAEIVAKRLVEYLERGGFRRQAARADRGRRRLLRRGFDE
jgi:hypothetical protein